MSKEYDVPQEYVLPQEFMVKNQLLNVLSTFDIINLNSYQKTSEEFFGAMKFYTQTTFPDGQTHLRILKPKVRNEVEIIPMISIKTPDDIWRLELFTDALRRTGRIPNRLIISYLMGARYDRPMLPGDPFPLKIVANRINELKYNTVFIFEPHSDVSPALIDNSVSVPFVPIFENIKSYPNGVVLIVPDAGASKKSEVIRKNNPTVKDVVQCIKHRDFNTGAIDLRVLEPEKCNGQDCVIVDDLCDGGGTFLSIASQITPNSLDLYVAHGVFSKGLDELNKNFDRIITTDSYTVQGASLSFKTIIKEFL